MSKNDQGEILRKTIMQFFRQNPDQWFTVTRLTDLCGIYDQYGKLKSPLVRYHTMMLVEALKLSKCGNYFALKGTDRTSCPDYRECNYEMALEEILN